MYKKISKIVFISMIIMLVSCTNKKIMQYKNYAMDYLDNGNYEEALSYFNEAIKVGNGEVGSTQYELLLYKAECLFLLSRYDEARDIYNTLLSIDKNNKMYKDLYNDINTVTNLVNFKIAVNDGDITKADEIYKNLKELGLEHEKSVMYNQAVLYEKKGEWKNALNAFNYYLKQYPGDENASHEVAFINAQLNNVNN